MVRKFEQNETSKHSLHTDNNVEMDGARMKMKEEAALLRPSRQLYYLVAHVVSQQGCLTDSKKALTIFLSALQVSEKMFAML